jgi:hypothetical protein
MGPPIRLTFVPVPMLLNYLLIAARNLQKRVGLTVINIVELEVRITDAGTRTVVVPVLTLDVLRSA